MGDSTAVEVEAAVGVIEQEALEGVDNTQATSLAGLLHKPTLRSASSKDIVEFIDKYDLYSGNLPDGQALAIRTCVGAKTWRSLERIAMARNFLEDRDEDLPMGMSDKEIRKLLEKCSASITGNSSLSRIQRLRVFDVKLSDARMDDLLESYELALKDARDQGLEWREVFPAFKRTIIKDNDYLKDEFKAKEHSFTSVKRVTSFLYRVFLDYKRSVEVIKMMAPESFRTKDPQKPDPQKPTATTNPPKSTDNPKPARGNETSQFQCWGCGGKGHKVTECPSFKVETDGKIKAKTGDKKPKRERLFIKKEAGGAGVKPSASMPMFKAHVGAEKAEAVFYLDSGSAVSVLAAPVFDRLTKNKGVVQQDVSRYLVQLDGSVFEASQSVTLPVTLAKEDKGEPDVHLPAMKFYRSPGKLSFLGWPDMVAADLVGWLADSAAKQRLMETYQCSPAVAAAGVGPSDVEAEPVVVASPPTNAPFDVNDTELQLDGDQEGWSEPKIGEDPEGEIRSVLEEYKHLFPTALPKEPARVPPVEFKLKEGVPLPKPAKPRPLSRHKREAVKQIISKMLEAEIIEPSDSPHASPIVLAVKPKKTGIDRWRLCCDYREWNKVFEGFSYPLPRTQQLLDAAGQGNLFASMDLKGAYYQIPLSDKTKQQLAFVTPDGAYQWRRLPMGPWISPPIFVEITDRRFNKYDWMLRYMDDWLIVADGPKDLAKKMRIIFKECEHWNFVFEGGKCSFGMESLEYLGFIVSRSGVRIAKKRISTITDFPAPKTKRQVRRFLGMVNFCRRHLDNMSEIVAPLTALTKKDAPFRWTDECQQAFDRMKQVLTEAPVLRHFNPDLPTLVRTDASHVGSAGVLPQQEHGEWRPVAYCSHKFTPAELNYSTIEKEGFGIFHSVQQFDEYLDGVKFTIETDHKNLVHMQNCSTARVQRWRATLLGYDFSIRHIKGTDNELPDALSRMHEEANASDLQQDARSPALMAIGLLAMDREERPASVNDIIAQVHNAVVGHHGIHGSIRMLHDMGHKWKDMEKDVAEYIAKCDCQILNDRNGEPDIPMRSTEATEVFAVLAVDLAVNLPLSQRGNRHIFVVFHF